MSKDKELNPVPQTFESEIAELENKTNAQIAKELADLELEEKRLDLELKREAVAVNRAKRSAALETARAKTLATMQFLANREANQKSCNHRKGGRGPDAVMRGRGDDANRCVIFHKLPVGGTMVLCQRCGKEWMPANKWNTENGIIKPLPATPGWEDAIQWNTDNSPSGSSTFLFEKVDV